MKKNLAELFELQDDELFSQAQAAGKGMRKLRCSPLPIIGTCITQPVCRHCSWLNLRQVSPGFSRKRSLEEIIQHTYTLYDAGVDRVFMPSGWMGYEVPDYFYEYITAVKQNSNMEVYGLFGAVNKKCLIELKNAGMDGMRCGLESPNEQIYRKFRLGGDSLGDRKECLYAAREIGLKIWSGFIFGLGETQRDMINGLEFLMELDVDSVSILPFIPYPYTEMRDENPANPLEWARAVAITRIYLDTVNIFGSTDSIYCNFERITGINGKGVVLADEF